MMSFQFYEFDDWFIIRTLYIGRLQNIFLFQSFRVPLPWAECPTTVNELNQTSPIEECQVTYFLEYADYNISFHTI